MILRLCRVNDQGENGWAEKFKTFYKRAKECQDLPISELGWMGGTWLMISDRWRENDDDDSQIVAEEGVNGFYTKQEARKSVEGKEEPYRDLHTIINLLPLWWLIEFAIWAPASGQIFAE